MDFNIHYGNNIAGLCGIGDSIPVAEASGPHIAIRGINLPG